MSQSEPNLTVVIPVHNAAPHLGACVESLLAQSYTDFELILVENGSSDDSRERCARYAAEHPGRIRTLTLDEASVSAARNAGIDNARGRFITFMDADNWAEKEFLAEFFRDPAPGPGTIVMQGILLDFSEAEPPGPNEAFFSYDDGALAIGDDPSAAVGQRFLQDGCSVCKLYHTETLRRLGIRFIEHLCSREDHLFFFTCISRMQSVVWRSGLYMHYMRRGRNTLSTRPMPACELVEADVLVDATELGDVARMAGVPYDVGMDSSAVTHEDIAPAEANGIVQDLTYVAVLKDYGRDVTIPRPDGYDPSLFACCCVNDLCVAPKEPHRMWSREMMITYGKLPNGKYMINWPIEGNDYYVDMIDMTPEERADAVRRAKSHTLSFVYFLQHELGFNTLGLADDEFPTDDRLPFIPYHRESRRIHGAVRFTLNDITDPYAGTLYRTAVGVGDYPVDQHHTRYSGWDDLPDLYFHPIPSYGFPLGIVIPAGFPGLLVAEKSVSVTNLVNGSTRLQPVVLQIGQATGALAALAAAAGVDPSEVAVRRVQEAVLDAGGYLLPYLDLPAGDPRFKAMQRIGVTGILKGRGANVGWENQTWFDADRTIAESELREGLREVYPSVRSSVRETPVDGALLTAMLAEALGKPAGDIAAQTERAAAGLLSGYDPVRPLTRLECALLIDAVADPFHAAEVDIYGNYKRK